MIYTKMTHLLEKILYFPKNDSIYNNKVVNKLEL